jgi:hypothetical protein
MIASRHPGPRASMLGLLAGVFALSGGWLSGHTIKHALAALAVYAAAMHLQRRHAVPPAPRNRA